MQLSLVAVTLVISGAGAVSITVMFDGQMMVGPVVSTIHSTVRETGVAALPQPSVTVQVRVLERLQPVEVSELSEGVGMTASQVSVAVAVRNAASISAAVGLRSRGNGVPVAVITGGVVSTFQVAVRETG